MSSFVYQIILIFATSWHFFDTSISSELIYTFSWNVVGWSLSFKTTFCKNRLIFLFVSSPFTACLPPLFPLKPTQASWDHLPKPLCSPVLVSKSAFGNSLEDKYLPQGLLWPLEQENKTKPGSMLIQTGDSKTSRNLFFYCTLFTSKFSCTGGLGHFPRWNACPSAAPKRPARAGSSSSAGIIFGLGVWTGTWRGESKAAGAFRASEGASPWRSTSGLVGLCGCSFPRGPPEPLILRGHRSHPCGWEVFLLCEPH